MPSLTIQFGEHIRRGSFATRVLIGRANGNGVVVPSPEVSRLHAWVGIDDEGPYIADSFSRAGVEVNGKRIDRRAPLRDGDVIGIGPAKLTFSASGDAEEDLVDDLRFIASDSGGLLFDCSCGAPVWASREMVGRRGRCSHCARRLLIPETSGATAVVLVRDEPVAVAYALDRSTLKGKTTLAAASPETSLQDCSICQGRIETTDPRSVCSECGLTFHSDCWVENRGCSAYGCSQVGALDQTEESALPAHPEASDASPMDSFIVNGQEINEGPSVTWDVALLAGSVVALAVGGLAFGGLSAVMFIVALIFLKKRAARFAVVCAAMGISAVGIGAGVIVSRWWWLGASLPGIES